MKPPGSAALEDEERDDPARGRTPRPAPAAGTRPVFVARETYRHRRMMDAAALLPVLGALLFALPLLWMGQEGGAARTSHVMIYVFAVWAALAILAAAISRVLGNGGAAPGDAGEDDDEGAPPPEPR